MYKILPKICKLVYRCSSCPEMIPCVFIILRNFRPAWPLYHRRMRKPWWGTSLNTRSRTTGTTINQFACFWGNFIHYNLHRQIRYDFLRGLAKPFFRNMVLNWSYTSSKWPWSIGKFEHSTRGWWGRVFFCLTLVWRCFLL